jgi:hypothetical protein
MTQPLSTGPVPTEPGCTHRDCVLEHPHTGPSLLAENPHQVDEDPEENIGLEIPDPWSDDRQTDWPNEEIEV